MEGGRVISLQERCVDIGVLRTVRSAGWVYAYFPTLGSLVAATPSDLLRVEDIGPGTVLSVQVALEKLNLSLVGFLWTVNEERSFVRMDPRCLDADMYQRYRNSLLTVRSLK